MALSSRQIPAVGSDGSSAELVWGPGRKRVYITVKTLFFVRKVLINEEGRV